MLSIAYGSNQHDSTEVHKPEVCYPAQGFQIVANRNALLSLSDGLIPVRRLVATIGQQRSEPITYWIMTGEHAVADGLNKKIAELRYGLTGKIPDGMLVRISSIDRNEEAAFTNHDNFIGEMISSLTDDSKLRISGLGKW